MQDTNSVLEFGMENEEIKKLLELLKKEIKRVEEIVDLLELYVAYEEVSKECEELAKDWDVTVSDGLDDEWIKLHRIS